MKKLITLLFIILLSGLTVKSANTYLIYSSTTGGTWTNTAGITNPVPVDLSTVNGGSAASLNAWFTDRSLAAPTMGAGSQFVAGDQVWIISGTYVLTGIVNVYAGTSVYGGFSGTEQTVGERAKGTNAWDFTNTTIIDGAATYIGISSPTNTSLMDGLTIQNCKNSGTASFGGGARLTGSSSTVYSTMQNCIVKNCSSFVASAPAGVVVTTYAKLLNSYIYNNICSSPATTGGGVQVATGTVSGCTIDHNTALGPGGGLYISGSSATTVSNNIIINNTGNSGGGIGTYNSGSLTVTNCTISSNSAATGTNGGGIYIDNKLITNPLPIIKNCVIQSNTCPTGMNGSAIYLKYGGTVNNCVITGNTGPSAVCVPAGMTGTIQNCTVASNILNDGTTESNINLGTASTSSVFTNCLFYKSTATPFNASTGTAPTVTYCGFDRDLSTTYTGTGNIFTIGSSSFVDAANNDYHLATGSTPIDAGTTIAACSPDIAGVTRPKGTAYDMGAYELDLGTGLQKPQADFTCFSFNQSIELRGVTLGEGVSVYTLTGSKIKSVKINSSNISISLPKGIYMVKISDKVKKIVVM